MRTCFELAELDRPISRQTARLQTIAVVSATMAETSVLRMRFNRYTYRSRTVNFHDHGLHTHVMHVDAYSISHLPDQAFVRSNIAFAVGGKLFWCNILHSRWCCTNCCMHHLTISHFSASFRPLAIHEPDSTYQDILNSLYIPSVDIRVKHVLTAAKVFND